MYIGMAIGRVNAPYIAYSSTDKLLSALNYDTTGMTILEDFSVFNKLKVDGIDGSGTVTLSYLKSHVVKKDSGYITSDDIGRRISVSFLDSESLEAEIVDLESGMFGAMYNMDLSGPPTVFPAYEFINADDHQMFFIFLENKLEENSFNVSVSFVDTGDVMLNSTATFMQASPEMGYAYQVNLPVFDITSTLDPSDNETFNFSNMTYYNMEGSFVILGNASMMMESMMMENLPSNSDPLCVAIGMMGSFPGNGAVCLFPGANPPYSEDFALSEAVMEGEIDSWLMSIMDETGLEEFDIYTALLSDITINEAYVVKGKLDGKYVDIDTTPEIKDGSPIYANYRGKLELYYGNGITAMNRMEPYDYEGRNAVRRLEIDYYTASSTLAGAGLATDSGKLKVQGATNTTFGGIKARLDGDTLYITTNNTNP